MLGLSPFRPPPLYVVVDQLVVTAHSTLLARKVWALESARPESLLLLNEHGHVLFDGRAHGLFPVLEYLVIRFGIPIENANHCGDWARLECGLACVPPVIEDTLLLIAVMRPGSKEMKSVGPDRNGEVREQGVVERVRELLKGNIRVMRVAAFRADSTLGLLKGQSGVLESTFEIGRVEFPSAKLASKGLDDVAIFVVGARRVAPPHDHPIVTLVG